MSAELLQRPIFFSIRKNSSYFMWSPYNGFFDFRQVCIETISEDSFVLYNGSCLKVDRLGRKYLVSATRFKHLRNGIYLLVAEGGGRYAFRLVKPLWRNT
jgi:hypothetical protein